MDASTLKYGTFVSQLSPCGENMEYDPRMMALEEDIVGKPEQQMGDSIIPATPPNWKDILKNAASLLEDTRDLRVFIYWTAAQLAREGLSGLYEGLQHILYFSTEAWDELWPVPDDGDVQERLSAFALLSPMAGSFDADMTVVQLLLDQKLCFSHAVGNYSLRDIREAQETGNEEARKLIRAAYLDSPEAELEKVKTCIDNILQCLRDIRECYDHHGMGTPDLRMITDIVKEMQLFYKSQPAEQPSAPASVPAAEAPVAVASPVAPAATVGAVAAVPVALPAAAPGVINGRQDAIRTMKALCQWFEENEPSSPVPYFLKRAIRCVGANLFDIVEDLAPQMKEQLKLILKPDPVEPHTAPQHAAPVSTPAPAPVAAPAPAPEPPPAQEYFNPFG